MGPPANATHFLKRPVRAGATTWAHARLWGVNLAAEALEASLVCLLENVSIQVLFQTVLLRLMSGIQYLVGDAIDSRIGGCILVVLLCPVEREAFLHADCVLLLSLVAQLVARCLVFLCEKVLVVDLGQIACNAANFLSLSLQTGFFCKCIAWLRCHILDRRPESTRHVHLFRLVDAFQLCGHHRVLLFVSWVDRYGAPTLHLRSESERASFCILDWSLGRATNCTK